MVTGQFELDPQVITNRLDRVLLDPSWDSLQAAGLEGVARFGLAFVLLLAPTAMMGATLPVLCNALAGTVRRPGEVVGRLYGLNTLGGVLGCLVAGFLVLEHIGLRNSAILAGLTNLALAGTALWFDRRYRSTSSAEAESEAEGEEAPQRSVARAFVLFAILFTSSVSISAEMGWTRLLALAVGGTAYAFSLVLAMFLTGLGLGSLLVAWGMRRWSWGSGALGLAQAVVGLIMLAGVSFYDDGVAWIGKVIYDAGGEFSSRAWASLLATSVLVLPPSFLFGLSFPVLTQMWVRGRGALGRGVGLVYVVSTVGGVLGSTVTTFLLLPRFGLERSLTGLAVASAVFGALFLLLTPRFAPLRALASAVLLSITALFLLQGGPLRDAEAGGVGGTIARWTARESWDQQKVYGGVFLYGDLATRARRQVRSVRDGSACSVAVFEQRGVFELSVNGKVDASGSKDMGTQLMLSWLPQVFHPDPREVFVLGWGSGVTAGAAAEYGSRVVCAEIESEVVQAAEYFEDLNFSAADRVEVVVDDGRSVLRRTDRRFDVITTEPSNPWMAGMSSLFTREFYELCRDRLNEDGVICQWVQLYWSSYDDYCSILATLRSVFPHVILFRSTFADSLMLASAQPLDAAWPAIAERLAAHPQVRAGLSEYLEEVKDEDGAVLAYLGVRIMAWGNALDPMVQDAALITDDKPFLEFRAARRMKADSSTEILARLEDCRIAELFGESVLTSMLSAEQRTWAGRERARLLQDIGVGLLRNEEMERALVFLDQAASRSPALPEIEFQRWGACLRLGRPEAKTERFEAMLRTTGHALHKAAELAIELEEWGLALRANQAWQRKRGGSGDVFLQRGIILRGIGRLDEARSAFEQALRTGADPTRVQLELEKLSTSRP